MAELLIAEKPQAALKIATALADSKIEKESIDKVPYYTLKHNGKEIIVGCAVGHLYNLKEKEKKGWTYPVFDLEWVPAYETSKSASFSKKYLNVLKKLTKKVDSFVVATDFDSEGSLIGFNCIRFIFKQKNARRMKFSTLTKDELVSSYENAMPHLDFPLIESGETRHFADYFWGINLSRALTLAVKSAGAFKLLSVGRVQGPALKIIVDRESEIKNFKPEPYWEISLDGTINKNHIKAWHVSGKIFEKKKAESILKNTKGKKALISNLEEKETSQSPLPPFDLTTLQTESYRYFGISPKETLAIAQDLYTAGLISYPRTSSQKLPAALGHEKIIKSLSKIKEYSNICQEILKKPLKPAEGEKSDPAHPAIFATGEYKKLTDKQNKIYDLIARRFLACFSTPLKRKTLTAEVDCNKELVNTKGVKTLEKGWHVIYHFPKFDEQELPLLKLNQEIENPKVESHEDKTKPPNRYSEASLIKELEKKNLGTKATRANIIDNLFQRNYVTGKSIEATVLGMATVETLKKYCPEILDEELTRHFEEEMEGILEGKKREPEILEETKEVLTKVLKNFKKNEKIIGEGLLEATRETKYELETITKCHNCKEGMLAIRRGKFGQFLACNQYPKCKTTSSLPQGLIKKTKEVCKECLSPVVLVVRAGKRPFNYCINKQCPAKLRWIEEQQKKTQVATPSKTKKKTSK